MKITLLPRLIVSSLVPPMIFLSFACSSRPAYHQRSANIAPVTSTQSAMERAIGSSQVSMQLEAYPRQGFAPLSVSFHATLAGLAQNDPKFACTYQEWDFGDGGVSGEKHNCVSEQSENTMETEFLTEHVFTKSGSYVIRFKLGNNQIVSKRIAVTVYDRF